MEQRSTLEKIWRLVRRYNRYIKVSLISLIAIVIAVLPLEMFGINAFSPIQQRMVAIFVWAALMWIIEAVPAWTTSLLIIITMLLTVSNSGISLFVEGHEGLMNYKDIMNTFANPTVMLFMGGFILALVASKSGIDISMARAMLKPFGSNPKVVLFGFMLVTAIFSMFVSNTATAAMMLTFMAPVLRQLPASEKGTAALALAIPIGANIGGLATPIGTPPNGIALQYINDVDGLNLGVDFGEWTLVMTPLMLAILLISWFLLNILYPFTSKKVNIHIMGGAKKGWRTYVIYGTLAATILLWMFEKVTGINSYVVALIPIGVFAITRIIKSSDLKDIDWACLWMVAGGFALGEGMSKTGLAKVLVEAIPFEVLEQWPIAIMVGGGLICWLLSQFISNSAATALMVPIMVAVGKGMEGPLGAYGGVGTLLIGVAMAASFAMALPISTPPNAIAYSTGLIKTKQMFVTGLMVGAISLAIGYMLIIFVGKAGYFG